MGQKLDQNNWVENNFPCVSRICTEKYDGDINAHSEMSVMKTLAFDETCFSDVVWTIVCERCLSLERPGERLNAAQPFDPMLPRVLAPEVSRLQRFRFSWKWIPGSVNL